MENGLEQQVLAKAQKWLDGNYDAETKKQVKYLMDNDMKELVESFYKDLEFGTGGLRGVMGVGTNRMNIYTVGAATQGLSNYLKRNFAGEEIRVVVGHDSRNNSRMFAERVADIFASNGFTVFLFDALRPTPELSFAIRELNTTATKPTGPMDRRLRHRTTRTSSTRWRKSPRSIRCLPAGTRRTFMLWARISTSYTLIKYTSCRFRPRA